MQPSSPRSGEPAHFVPFPESEGVGEEMVGDIAPCWDSHVVRGLLPMSPLPFLRGKKTDTQLPRAPQNTDSITQPPRKGVLHMTEFWLMRSKQQWAWWGVGSAGVG